MNNRDYKRCGNGEFYHIYNRGNTKGDIFLEEEDFKFFILRLRQNLFPDQEVGDRIVPLPANSFSLIAYCLMPNHFHLLIHQTSDIPTSKLLSKICTSYSKYFNKKYNRIGHLFQDQFKQVNVADNGYLLWLSSYIHQNPKVAGLVGRLEEYPWSSYTDFVAKRNDTLCKKEVILQQFKNSKEYENFVDDSYATIRQRKELDGLLLD